MSNKVPCGGFELGESLIMKDGKLDLVEGAGGSGGSGNQLSVIIGCESKTGKPTVCDTSFETILEALLTGIPVIAFAVVEGSTTRSSSAVYYELNNRRVVFSFVALTGPTTLGLANIYYNSDGRLYDTEA